MERDWQYPELSTEDLIYISNLNLKADGKYIYTFTDRIFHFVDSLYEIKFFNPSEEYYEAIASGSDGSNTLYRRYLDLMDLLFSLPEAISNKASELYNTNYEKYYLLDTRSN